jgi:hypothetical protein
LRPGWISGLEANQGRVEAGTLGYPDTGRSVIGRSSIKMLEYIHIPRNQGDQMSFRKIAQNVAQRIFLPNLIHNFVIYKKPKLNNHLMDKKFAQSGHPDRNSMNAKNILKNIIE